MAIKIFDKSGIKGHVKVFVNGKLWYDDHNVVVNLGKERVAKWLASETSSQFDSMIIGNFGASPPNCISPTAPSTTDTGLSGRIGATPMLPGQSTLSAAAKQSAVISRSLATVRYDATFNSNDVLHSSYKDFDGSGGGANLGLNAIYVSELGLITAAASDELAARVTFAPISFINGSSTSISVQWSLSVI